MEQSRQPEMVLVCGSNGAGKSTLTYAAREKGAEKMPFIDPDKVAKDKQCSPIEAGRIVSFAAKKYIEDKRSFVRESTLTAKFDFQLIQAAKEKGFKVSLVYVGIGSAEEAVSRVKARHENGGHSVPEEDVKRRYARSLENLPEAIKQVDSARIVDNSSLGYRDVASFEKGKMVSHQFTPEWFKRPLEKVQERISQPEKPSQALGQENKKKHNSGPER